MLIYFGVLLALMIGWGLMARGARLYTFPFLAGVVSLGFIFPQMVGIARSGIFDDTTLEWVFGFILLCTVAVVIGYLAGSKVKVLRESAAEVDPKRALAVAAVLSLAGSVFYFMLSRLPEEELRESQWSGRAVALHFMGQMLSYGFAIAMVAWARFRIALAIPIILFGSVFFLERIIFWGRRAVTLEFFLIIAVSLWFARGWRLPRPVFLALMAAAALGLHSTGEYRSVATDAEARDWSQLRNIPLVQNFIAIFEEGGTEVRSAVSSIEAIDHVGEYDYGLSHWNRLVFNYVPAQIVGPERKQALMAELPEYSAYMRYETPNGSTVTGYTDAFASFGWFGALKFFAVGFLLAWLFRRAASGSFNAQVLYALVLVPSLHTITHNTHWLISPWPHMAVFLLPGLLLLKRRKRLVRAKAVTATLVPSPAQ